MAITKDGIPQTGYPVGTVFEVGIAKKHKVLRISPSGGWQTDHLGTGGATLRAMYCEGFTGVDPVSRGRLYVGTRGLNSGDISHYNIDFDKRIEVYFIVLRLGSDSESRSRIQLKCASGWGDLAELGIGLRISNYAVEGEAYGIARGTVNLSDLQDDRLRRYRIVHIPNGSVQFWANGVLEGTLTGDYVPRGNDADGHFSLGISNGATGGFNCWFEISQIVIVQDW